MKRFLPLFSLTVLLASGAVLMIAFQLWRDTREERIKVEVARQFTEAALVEAKRERARAEAAAERSRDTRLAGPATEDGWDFSGTGLSDDAWKLTRDSGDGSGKPQPLPEPESPAGFPPPSPEPAPAPGGP